MVPAPSSHLLRASICERVAPLALVAKRRLAIGRRTTGACDSRLLALSTPRDHVLVHMPHTHRMGQSRGYTNRKQHCGPSL